MEQAQGADPENPDEYRALNIFLVPPDARWTHLKAQARQSGIGQLVDDAMTGIERDNAVSRGKQKGQTVTHVLRSNALLTILCLRDTSEGRVHATMIDLAMARSILDAFLPGRCRGRTRPLMPPQRHAVSPRRCPLLLALRQRRGEAWIRV